VLSTKYGVPVFYQQLQTLNVDLLEYNGDTILCREFGNSLIAVLLEYIEDHECLGVSNACDGMGGSS
jgi:hypothetical protein